MLRKSLNTFAAQIANTWLYKLISSKVCSLKAMSTLKNLGIGHCNIEGGLSGNLAKTTEIKNVIYRENLDIFGINETNLSPATDTDSLNIPINYKLERCDRPNGSSRGGCGVIISKKLKFRIYPINIIHTDMSKIEAIWIELTELNILLCFFYRSQKFTPVDTFLDYMFECMMQLNGRKVVWVGDVNIDQRNLNDLQYKKLDITMKMFGMIQVVTEITRRSYRNGLCTESTIDVVMTNCYSDFTQCKVLDDRIGDHETIKFEMNSQVPRSDKFKKIVIRNHSKKNLEALIYYLSEVSDYSSILNCGDIDGSAEGFNEHIIAAYEQFCPTKIIKCHSNYLFNPSKELLENITVKKKLYRKYKKAKLHSPNSEKCKRLWNEYKAFKNKSVTRISKRDRKQNIVNDLKMKSSKNDLKGIWKTIKMASNLPTMNSNKNENSQLDEEKLNKYFTSVGTNVQADIPPQLEDKFLDSMPDNSSLEGMDAFNEVTEGDVIDYISSLDNDKSINDAIPTKIYKCILPSVIIPFTHIINKSLSSGIMPALCKKALITPVYKGEGDRLDPGNYRPISILPLLGKCIEYFVNLNLIEYINNNNVLNDRQFGFRKDNSTTYLMLELFDKIYSSKEQGKKPAILFLDIKKAFDTVNHTILLRKLKHYGISGNVYKWFKSYLSNRFQSTRLGKGISIALLILCGVPQGSILGPILFSIFINDIVNVCKESLPFLFADDGALYIDHVDRSTYANVKSEVKFIIYWLWANKLCLNPDKTKVMIFDNEMKLDHITVKIDDNTTLTVKEEKIRTKKYLGLVLDHKLKFFDHIDYVKKKIAKRIGAMYKSKSLLPLKYRKMFANSLMLPYFDYLDNIWNKTNKTKLNELDILYKKTAKIALDYNPLESSKKVYKDMKWLPLHLRRQLHTSTYMYKIINGLSPPQLRDKFVYISGGSRGGNNCNLYTKKSKSHKQFFYLGAKCWNLLPQTVRHAESAKHFSITLKNNFFHSIDKDPNYLVDNTYDKLYELNTLAE